MTTLVFDIETVPDTDTAARLFDLQGLSEKEIAEVMFTRRRQETDNRSDFLRLHLHKVVAISVLLANSERLAVWSLAAVDAPERELVQRFFDGIEKYTPTLVSWNGRCFDLPVLHYRGLLHGVQAGRYWEMGDELREFRWNNYLNRYHLRHTDLMDVIAGYEYRANAPLHEVATMLGFPGKLGMNGQQVWDCYLAGERQAIRDYCETDALNTWLVYLRFQLMRGRLDADGFAAECQRLRAMLAREDKPHLTAFLEAWPD